MHSASLCSPQAFALRPQHRKVGLRQGKGSAGKIMAAGKDDHDWDSSGRLVDESMIVLRKRIQEMKMMERNYEPPSDWTEWEKKYYASYDSCICRAVGLLQTQLMKTRPSLALGMVALVLLSVPTSMVMIVLRFMETANGVLSEIHL
ncbi:PREDICTED: uncharacterized protein LOC104587763 [Nelumbo nucifera]|uniref:Uncharacterized protein LOC104587763 n=2 Tax=Nelumbo nucifera TaxID=4432 RepID=A0A1U7YTW0_NELNU|nr:PREDICTED: uncharacterized protein LOC104587763 [Nelumbo nucifera]DAD31980.1 TPA_asm: hypothetical protein HUJ06_010831 [Nelumbo nucifera]